MGVDVHKGGGADLSRDMNEAMVIDLDEDLHLDLDLDLDQSWVADATFNVDIDVYIEKLVDDDLDDVVDGDDGVHVHVEYLHDVIQDVSLGADAEVCGDVDADADLDVMETVNLGSNVFFM